MVKTKFIAGYSFIFPAEKPFSAEEFFVRDSEKKP
jgi:hypothetical protein